MSNLNWGEGRKILRNLADATPFYPQSPVNSVFRVFEFFAQLRQACKGPRIFVGHRRGTRFGIDGLSQLCAGRTGVFGDLKRQCLDHHHRGVDPGAQPFAGVILGHFGLWFFGLYIVFDEQPRDIGVNTGHHGLKSHNARLHNSRPKTAFETPIGFPKGCQLSLEG